MVLVGPSGCGKTTALRMVAGLEDVSEGVLRIGERVVNDVPSRDRDIAMVFQSYALYPHLSVYENIAFGLRIKGVKKAEVDRRVREAARDARARAVPEAQAPGPVGRAAPAGGDGARDRAPAAGVPDGRAAVEPRRQAARPDAGRDLAAAAGSRGDDDLRHPRPDRGHDDGRPRGRHAQGGAAAGRSATGAVRPSRQPVRRRVHRQPRHEPARSRGRAPRTAASWRSSGASGSPSTRRRRPAGLRSPSTGGGRSCSASGRRTSRTRRSPPRRRRNDD